MRKVSAILLASFALLTFILIEAIPVKVDGIPEISVVKINSGTIKKYEKFELTLAIGKANIKNPYDPDDIDVYSEFTSPGGEVIKVNGFYDDYRNAGAWKIRFSPSKTGKWSYRVFAKNNEGSGKSESGTFDCVGSDHHGWIRTSEKYPHYFVQDDGTSWYGVAAYSPWGNSPERIKTYADHKANLLALWDISYGGMVDGTGLIEMELGKYNQEKCGRIDSLLGMLEKDDIKLMLAIWPHDLFSKTVWAHQWDNNPLSKVTDVENVYSDSVAWVYQIRKYRYLIARFAYSRSFGIWELINEMDGTDGWMKGHHQEAYDWVAKANKYFAENDPYRHPATASFSGGYTEYRTPLYERTDIPNIHLYEAQGWPLKYPGDTLRSSMYNYAWASRRFWNSFNKPAIFGEAGADLTYIKPKRPEYHDHYHNAIWASLSNGLAATPVWWTVHELSERDWDHLQYLSEFVKDIDLDNADFEPAEIHADNADVFGMLAEGNGFGWARTYSERDISGKIISVKIPGGNYEITWFDTWTGKFMKPGKVSSAGGEMKFTVPKLAQAQPDVAFKIKKL